MIQHARRLGQFVHQMALQANVTTLRTAVTPHEMGEIHGQDLPQPAGPFAFALATELREIPVGLEEGFLDGILRQGLVAKDQAGRPEQLKAVPVNHLLEGVAIAVPPPLDDASEHRIHEHANPIDAPGAVTG